LGIITSDDVAHYCDADVLERWLAADPRRIVHGSMMYIDAKLMREKMKTSIDGVYCSPNGKVKITLRADGVDVYCDGNSTIY